MVMLIGHGSQWDVFLGSQDLASSVIARPSPDTSTASAKHRRNERVPQRGFSAIMLALAMAAAVACEGPSFPPETCAAPIRDRIIYAGNSEPVAVCFVDPDGEEITLSATSSDDVVVAVRTQRDAVVIEGRSVGSATVTVIARDPDGDMGSETFSVEVPNREPRSRRLPPLTLSDAEKTAELILTEYFTDPDGQPLKFLVSTDRPEIVSTTVTGGILALRLEASGSAAIRVVATDPHGLSATEVFDVSGVLFETLLRDDFDRGYDSWNPEEGTTVSVVEGRLAITSSRRESEFLPLVTQTVPAAVGWKLTANVEAAAGSSKILPTLVVQLGDQRHVLGVIFGGNIRDLSDDPLAPETNLIVFAGTAGGVSTGPGLYTLADEIKGPGQVMDVAMSMGQEFVEITVDGVVVFEVELRSIARSVRSVGLAGWRTDMDGLSSDDIVYFDWVQLEGFPMAEQVMSRPVRSSAPPPRFPASLANWRVSR